MDEKLTLGWISKKQLLSICPISYKAFQKERKKLKISNLDLAMILRFKEYPKKYNGKNYQKIIELYRNIVSVVKKKLKLTTYLFTYGEVLDVINSNSSLTESKIEKIFEEGKKTIFVAELNNSKQFKRAGRNKLPILEVLI